MRNIRRHCCSRWGTQCARTRCRRSSRSRCTCQSSGHRRPDSRTRSRDVRYSRLQHCRPKQYPCGPQRRRNGSKQNFHVRIKIEQHIIPMACSNMVWHFSTTTVYSFTCRRGRSSYIGHVLSEQSAPVHAAVSPSTPV